MSTCFVDMSTNKSNFFLNMPSVWKGAWGWGISKKDVPYLYLLFFWARLPRPSPPFHTVFQLPQPPTHYPFCFPPLPIFQHQKTTETSRLVPGLWGRSQACPSPPATCSVLSPAWPVTLLIRAPSMVPSVWLVSQLHNCTADHTQTQYDCGAIATNS